MVKLGLLLIILSTVVSVQSILCALCQISIKIGLATLQLIIPNSIAVEGLQALCMRKYDSQKLCRRVGEQIAPLAISNFLQNHLSVHKKCSTYCNGNFKYYYPNEEVQRILSGNKLKDIDLTSYVQQEEFTISKKTNINILHLSDIHQDQNYTEKSSIVCQYPICCHAQDGFPENPNAQAKKFGNKNCDSPPKLLNSFLDFIIKQENDVDIILGTGDFSAHNQWQKTKQSIIETQNKIEQKLKNYFPQAIFLKAAGNNDYAPDHQYNASQNPKLIKVTYIKVRQTNLTFISLNTIAFDQLNLFLLGQQSYAIFQLILLQQILEKNSNIYIFGHIPPTLSGTVPQYAQVYRALVTKYSSKIKGQFFGHTHSDQFIVNTNPHTQQPSQFGFICPSMSPLFIGTARSRIYRIVVTGNDNGISDYTQFILKNLEQPTPQWKIQYKFRQKYHLNNGDSPINLHQMINIKNKIFSNKEEQIKYIRSTGLNQQYGSNVHCLILDDFQRRKTCMKRSQSINDKIYILLGILRGQWGYNKQLIR